MSFGGYQSHECHQPSFQLSAVENAADVCCMKPVFQTSGEPVSLSVIVQECEEDDHHGAKRFWAWLNSNSSSVRTILLTGSLTACRLVGRTIGSVERVVSSLNWWKQ